MWIIKIMCVAALGFYSAIGIGELNRTWKYPEWLLTLYVFGLIIAALLIP